MFSSNNLTFMSKYKNTIHNDQLLQVSARKVDILDMDFLQKVNFTLSRQQANRQMDTL